MLRLDKCLAAAALLCSLVLAGAVAAPLVRLGCGRAADRPELWSIPDVHRHLAGAELPLELRDMQSPADAPEAYLVAADGSVVLITRLADAAEASRFAALHFQQERAAAWGPFLIEGDPDLVGAIRSRLPE
jgi:hypothetical protein